MSIHSPERSTAPLDDTRAESIAGDIISSSLERLEKLAKEESFRQLEHLILTARRLELPKFARDGKIDEYIETVPGAAEFVKEIHEVAEHVLHDDTLDDESAAMIVNNLGVAADIVQDKSIITDTLEAIVDIEDSNLDIQRRALLVAQSGEQLYVDAFKDIRNGKAATLAAQRPYVPMNQRPNIEDEYAFLSDPTDNRLKLVNERADRMIAAKPKLDIHVPIEVSVFGQELTKKAVRNVIRDASDS